jgi:excisionase family DNA binding protein
MSTQIKSRPAAPIERSAYSVPEVLLRIGIGRDKLYTLIRSGELPARKVGRRTLIVASDLEAFLKALPTIGRAA